MIFLIQRVKHAEVVIEGETFSSIKNGLLILVGIEVDDKADEIEPLCKKALNLRIFADKENKMKLSLLDSGGDLLVVSQFTLCANTRKGNRPSYTDAARPDLARPLFDQVVDVFERRLNKKVYTGVFGADMQVSLQNDGPVTIYINSKK